MLLSSYLKEHSLSVKEFAEKLDISVASFVRLALPPGHESAMLPSPELIKRIYSITGGAVTPNDFYDLDPRPDTQGR